jgi:hypothetical protein
MSSALPKISKSERARLRELAEEAWDAELSEHLLELYEEFGRWANNGMSAFDLGEKIHQFHDGVSRELYKRYAMLDPAISVARAVALGFLGEEALGESLSRKLAREIQTFREMKDQ